MSPFSIESSSAHVHVMISSFFNQNLKKEIADFREKIRQIKATSSVNRHKSSRFTPKTQRFHLPKLKILKIYTQASIFHPRNLKILKIYTPSLSISPSRARNFKGFSQTQGSRFPSTHTYRTAPVSLHPHS